MLEINSMNKYIIIYTSILLTWLFILSGMMTDDKELWASIESPKKDYEVLLYQKERKLHQVPEILVYYKSKNSSFKKAVENIMLPEDDRNTLSYEYQWENNYKLTLTLKCDLCMINNRKYKIELKKIAKLTQIKNNQNKNLVFSDIQSL